MREPAAGGAERAAALVRRRQEEILARWEAAVRQLPGARGADAARLRAPVAGLLERVAQLVESGDGATSDPGPEPREHALQRLEAGFDAGHVVAELSLLRRVVLEACCAEDDPGARLALALGRVLDEAAGVTVEAYARAREKVFGALERLSRATLESRSVDDLLGGLLRALLEATSSIDTAAVLLREGDVLRLRAAVGLEADVEAGWAVPIGAGFSGRIAELRRPLTLRAAASDPLVVNARLRERGVRALHGVPLLDDGELLGVAYAGSLTVEQLGDWDRRLFEALAARASAGIALHLAREDAEARARALRDKEAELRAAVRERERANALLEGLLQNAPVGVGFWDRELRFQRVNDMLAAITGLPAAAHLGRRPAELLPGLEGMAELEARWREAIRTGRADEPRELVGETPAAPGVRRVLLEQSYLVRDGDEVVGLGAVIVDRTEERRSQEALALLARTSEVLAAVADPDVVAQRIARLLAPDLADWAGVVLREGKALRRFSAAAEPVGDEAAREALARLSTEPRPARRGLCAVLREGQPEIVATVDEPFLRELAGDGADRAAIDRLALRSWMAVPLRVRDEVVGAVALGRGPSGRRFDGRDLALAQEVARRCAVAIDNARLLLETRRESELRQRVLAIVSHDLRNPLSAVLMTAGRVAKAAPEGPAGERLRRAGDTIRRAAERMNRLIADLLDAAAVQAGRLSVTPTRQSPAALLREVADAFGPAAREKGLVLEVEAAAAPEVLADHDRIVQVLSNLVSNAVKVTAAGGVTLGVRVVGAEALFTVRDTGPGIPAELAPRIFEPYARGADAGYKGTGLGLWISKGIVDAHGGQLGFETTPGAGTTFHFTLPLA